jgi:hypothetical protein
MESGDVRKPVTAAQLTTEQEIKVRKAYLAPDVKRVSPAAAKNLLVQHTDAGDPEVQHMLDCIDELQGEKGS